MSVFRHLSPAETIHHTDEGISTLRGAALMLGGVALGVGAMYFLGEKEAESQNPIIQEQKSYFIENDLSTIVATPVMGVSATVESKWDSPDLNLGVGRLGLPDARSTFRISAPGDFDLTIDTAFAQIIRTEQREITEQEALNLLAENSNYQVMVEGKTLEPLPTTDYTGGTETGIDIKSAQILPTDIIEIAVNRRSLRTNRARINAELYDSTIVIKDGFITERNGEKLDSPVPAIGKDGTYEIPRLQTTGEDSAYSDAIEGLTVWKDEDLNEEADETLLAAAQLAVSAENCLGSIFEIVDLDALTERAFVEKILGTNPSIKRDQIRLKFTDQWPSAADIKDENNRTAGDRERLFNEANSDSMKITFVENCDVSNLMAEDIDE